MQFLSDYILFKLLKDFQCVVCEYNDTIQKQQAQFLAMVFHRSLCKGKDVKYIDCIFF